MSDLRALFAPELVETLERLVVECVAALILDRGVAPVGSTLRPALEPVG